MKLFAQQGYGTGNGGRKIIEGLSQGYLHGAILSPKDYRLDRVQELLDLMSTQFGDADRLFDPQLYASLIAHDPAARMGRLLDEEYPYFGPRRRSDLESEGNVVIDLRACLEFQLELDVTSVIAPNIVIKRSFNSIEAVISKHFIRNAASFWEEIGDERPLLVTIAVDAEALQDRTELEAFLADITLMDAPPAGFYLLIANPTSQIAPELVDYRTMAGWMFLNHSLRINGFEVVNGFSDILTPFLCAAGGSAGATGWWANLKVFSMDRFEPPSPGGRRPVPRYLSRGLLNSIRFDEFQRLRDEFPGVVNQLPSDDLYDVENGSQPDGQEAEILQTWDTISSFAAIDEAPELSECVEWIETAEDLYNTINTSPAMRLSGRSNDAHLGHLRSGLELFAELAEIDL
ncbi:MAG: hypothetical protein KDM63_09250 [Verrucomicrobiae bacterium]|nr:hypothetical protein [Verrucomicrobiae bacterium]